ncbi:MAG TPA: hypothetical protein VF450_09280, partial [Noviherbaspirillum sp.]
MNLFLQPWSRRLLVASCIWGTLGICAPAEADSRLHTARQQQDGAGQAAPRDDERISRARNALRNLKTRLKLTPSQLPAWKAWFAGMLNDAAHPVAMDGAECDAKGAPAGRSAADAPELMRRSVACLRARAAGMQAELTRLEAAQSRTMELYDALDAGQRMTFDLFWYGMRQYSIPGQQQRLSEFLIRA